MTEAEWLACQTPHLLVEQFFGTEGLNRKRRLLLCACTRLMFPVNGEVAPRLEIAEHYADQLATTEQRREANKFARDRMGQRTNVLGYTLLNRATLQDASHANVSGAIHLLYRLSALEPSQLSDVIREIFGNPFRPVAFAREWRTEAVVALAKLMYESRDFGEMPILADALEDAGCDSADVIAHCRDPKGGHVRGCWVVDLVLGKS